VEFLGEVMDGVKGGIPDFAGMTVWIKGILEFLGEVMDGVKGDSCLESE
jgi:hypothetical protein